MKPVDEWVKTCLHKKKLREAWADSIIMRAKKEGTYMRKYHCPHCFGWHVTGQKKKAYYEGK